MHAPAIVTLDRNRTRQQTARLAEDPGRKSGRLAGGHVADMVALDRAVMLCATNCAGKFNAKAARYATRPSIPFAIGRCDGCGQMHPQNRLFVPIGRTYL